MEGLTFGKLVCERAGSLRTGTTVVSRPVSGALAYPEVRQNSTAWSERCSVSGDLSYGCRCPRRAPARLLRSSLHVTCVPDVARLQTPQQGRQIVMREPSRDACRLGEVISGTAALKRPPLVWRAMSANTALTIVIPLSAALVSAAALIITYVAGRRAARDSLVKLADDVTKLAAKYNQPESEELNRDRYFDSGQVEVAVQLAEFLRSQTPRRFLFFGQLQYPLGVCVTFARSLELFADYWLADRWWQWAVEDPDPYLRCRATANWASTLANRPDLKRGREMVEKAVSELKETDVVACVIRGDAYREMYAFNREVDWIDRARAEYAKIPDSESDTRAMYLEYLKKYADRIDAEAARASEAGATLGSDSVVDS